MLFRFARRFYRHTFSLQETQKFFTSCKTSRDIKPAIISITNFMKTEKLPDIPFRNILWGIAYLKQVNLNESNFGKEITNQFNANKNYYSNDTWALLLYLTKVHSLHDPNFVKNLYRDIPKHINQLGLKFFCYCIDGLTYRTDLLTQEIMDRVHEEIIRLEGKLKEEDLRIITSNLKTLNKYYVGSHKAYDSLENEIFRLKDVLSLRTIATAMSSFSIVARIKTLKIYSIMLKPIIAKLPEINDTCSIPMILNVYCQYVNLRLFEGLFDACAQIILQNPEPYMKSNLDMLMTIHSFSKTGLYSEIIDLVPIYVKELPANIKQEPSNLGVFFIAILKYPLPTDYLQKCLRWLVEGQHLLFNHHKAKILMRLVTNNIDCPEFFAHCLETVKFTDLDILYFKAIIPKLKALGFSINAENTNNNN
ncbi:unnamed protein product [Blepharisma stoltei]|uniref:FAST kinase leucine-rich domain-containing protein n=1 Tax=Blepharisma stoltei TaxID=1481888 RepID=A0AAU9JMV7_9CILI|nr:unnamed protein product [Blepharisma stoltei]